MTKEEAYNQATLEELSNSTGTRQDVIYKAMEIFAKQESILFANWTQENFFEYNTSRTWVCWMPSHDGTTDNTPYTSEQLYEKYIQSKNNTTTI